MNPTCAPIEPHIAPGDRRAAAAVPPSDDRPRWRGRVRGLLAGLFPGGRAFDRRRAPRFPYPRLIRMIPVAPDATAASLISGAADDVDPARSLPRGDEFCGDEFCGEEFCGEEFVVVGKYLSETGLGFFHPGPLPHRRVIAVLDDEHDSGESDSGGLRLLLDLTWCRFTRQGWYESGGRFVGEVIENC